MLLINRTIIHETVNNEKKSFLSQAFISCRAPCLILKNDHLLHATFLSVKFILPWFILSFLIPFRAKIEFVRLHWNVYVSSDLRCFFACLFGWLVGVFCWVWLSESMDLVLYVSACHARKARNGCYASLCHEEAP